MKGEEPLLCGFEGGTAPGVNGRRWSVGGGGKKTKKKFKGKCGWRGGERGNNDPQPAAFGQNDLDFSKNGNQVLTW